MDLEDDNYISGKNIGIIRHIDDYLNSNATMFEVSNNCGREVFKEGIREDDFRNEIDVDMGDRKSSNSHMSDTFKNPNSVCNVIEMGRSGNLDSSHLDLNTNNLLACIHQYVSISLGISSNVIPIELPLSPKITKLHLWLVPINHRPINTRNSVLLEQSLG